MKYTYSILIVLVAFFGLPPVIECGGYLADYIKQALVDKERIESNATPYIQNVRDDEPRIQKSITTPTTTKISNEMITE